MTKMTKMTEMTETRREQRSMRWADKVEEADTEFPQIPLSWYRKRARARSPSPASPASPAPAPAPEPVVADGTVYEGAWKDGAPLDSAALAGKVCDALVESGKLRENPAFIRGDREKLLAKIFGTAKLDGATLAGMSGRQVEVAVRNVTQGEAWVDDVENALKGMLSDEAKNSTEGAGESAEMKTLREKMVERARLMQSERECIVCFTSGGDGVACQDGHWTCAGCLGPYVRECCDRLAMVNLIESEAAEAERENNVNRGHFLAGRIVCPKAGVDGCAAPPFTDTQVTLHTDEETQKRYVEAGKILPEARAVTAAPQDNRLQEGQMLRLLMPNARMCGHCSCGPIDPYGCNDLEAHQGEPGRTIRDPTTGIAVRSSRIDNSCPRCGWFASSIDQWPMWNGVVDAPPQEPSAEEFAVPRTRRYEYYRYGPYDEYDDEDDDEDYNEIRAREIRELREREQREREQWEERRRLELEERQREARASAWRESLLNALLDWWHNWPDADDELPFAVRRRPDFFGVFEDIRSGESLDWYRLKQMISLLVFRRTNVSLLAGDDRRSQFLERMFQSAKAAVVQHVTSTPVFRAVLPYAELYLHGPGRTPIFDPDHQSDLVERLLERGVDDAVELLESAHQDLDREMSSLGRLLAVVDGGLLERDVLGRLLALVDEEREREQREEQLRWEREHLAALQREARRRLEPPPLGGGPAWAAVARRPLAAVARRPWPTKQWTVLGKRFPRSARI